MSTGVALPGRPWHDVAGGIAKAVDDFVRERPGEVVGKSAYISPEQARGEPPGPASDVFFLKVSYWWG